jgi:thiamine biosynthesis protein ThiS
VHQRIEVDAANCPRGGDVAACVLRLDNSRRLPNAAGACKGGHASAMRAGGDCRQPLSSAAMEIRLNGETRDVGDGISIHDLLEDLGLGARRVAVERNRDIVPRASYAEIVLQPGDVVEVVQFVGGG